MSMSIPTRITQFTQMYVLILLLPGTGSSSFHLRSCFGHPDTEELNQRMVGSRGGSLRRRCLHHAERSESRKGKMGERVCVCLEEKTSLAL
eukprot:c49740_g1_i1 orf=2-271(-)